MKQGDRLLLYTDGVTEADNAAGELFSASRLRNVPARSTGVSLDGLLGEIMSAVAARAGDSPQADDITVMAIEYRGGVTAPPHPILLTEECS